MSLSLIQGIPLIIGLFLWILTSDTLHPLSTLLAILVHECGHYWVAGFLGHAPVGLTWQPAGAKLETIGQLSYGQECFIALGGPVANLLGVLICLCHRLSLSSFFPSVSLGLALLNLLPISGFDGGKIARCIFCSLFPLSLAEKLSFWLSFFCLFCLWSISVYLLIRLGSSLSLFVFSAGVFWRLFKEDF